MIGNILKRKDICFKINKNKYEKVKFIYENVSVIDVENKSIRVSNDLKINYDFLILSPGISYKNDILQGYKVTDKKMFPTVGTEKVTLFSLKNN